MYQKIRWGSVALALSITGLSFLLIHSEFAGAVPIETITLCRIQGRGSSSRYEGDLVKTGGVVFEDLDDTWKRGFFIQDEECDERTDTSDGIYIYLDEVVDVVGVGDYIEVTGVVNEYFGLTEIVASKDDINILSRGNPLPTPVELSPPSENEASEVYFESLEGMYVRLDQSVVVGPTNSNDQTWLVRADLGVSRVFNDDTIGTGEIICVDDAGPFEIEPEVKVTDLVQDILGAVDYTFGDFCLQLSARPFVYAINPTGITHVEKKDDGFWSLNFNIATYNLANLFDTVDDPDTNDTVVSTPEYHRRLHKHALLIHDVLGEPIILAVQEVENLEVLQALLGQPEIESEYGIVWTDTPDQRGLDSALLYQTDSVLVDNYNAVQGCTSLKDGLGPDGNLDVMNPHNLLTCDTDGDGKLDGNRLFSRPPLLVQLQICKSNCSGDVSIEGISSETLDFYILINHWKSKSQDRTLNEYTLPRRMEQAHFVADLLDELSAGDPGSEIILLGDFNDFLNSQPLSLLTDAGFVNLLSNVPKNDRYTYIYKGVSQVLDHVFINTHRLKPVFVYSDHINADFPQELMSNGDSHLRSSDHDPVRVIFEVTGQSIYLPFLSP